MPKKKVTKKIETNGGVESIVDQIKEKYGEGSIMRLGEAKRVDVDTIPTGSVSLDIALGVGGMPRGRVIEIYGPESSGKTTLALHVVAEAQRMGQTCAYVDAEHALDPEYARKIGVKINDLLISQPDTGEQALDIVESLVKSRKLAVVVIDSVAALTPRAEIEGDMGKQHVGLQARLMSHALRKLTAHVAKSNTVVIFINQIRMKIGVMFGNPETTPGGNALKFYSSVRVEVRRAAKIQADDKIVGNRVRAKIVKNKVAAPFQVAEFDIMYNEGISKYSDIILTGHKYGAVEKSGNHYSFEGKKLGNGLEASRLALKEDKKLEKAVLAALNKKVKEEA